MLIDIGNMDVDGARLFLRQRLLLSKVVDGGHELTESEYDCMQGLINFCDHIADELEKNGLPHCLMMRGNNPDLPKRMTDSRFDSLKDADILKLQIKAGFKDD